MFDFNVVVDFYEFQDCVNGTLMPREMMPKKVNYTKLLGKHDTHWGGPRVYFKK